MSNDGAVAIPHLSVLIYILFCVLELTNSVHLSLVKFGYGLEF